LKYTVHSDSNQLRRLAGANESENIVQLILLQKVKNLGNLGDKVNVKPGYGRNYLVPQGKAAPATEASLAEFEKRRSEYEAKANGILASAEARKAALEGANVTIKANASPEGKLFGSVGPRDVAEAFSAAGHPLEKSEVVMGEGPLRHTGEFDIHVHLHADIDTTVKVIITPED
jgi:large subunit ribosomal protein L9